MSARLLHIMEALSRPLLFHPAKLEMILSAIGGRIGLEADRPSPETSRFVGQPSQDRAYRVENGIAIISIVGSLANRGAWIGASSGIVSYEGIGEQIRRAADGPVRGILLDINSGGGEATGMFRLAEQIRKARQSKRVVAYIDDVAASAAYGIASQAHEIVVSPTSIVGSIGVVLAHVDRSGELQQKGQRVTLIHAGANKVDGHPFGPLSEQVRADLQAEIGAFYDQFVATVVAGRPGLSDRAVRATEARTFIGEAAIKAGLADRVASLEDVIATFHQRNGSTSRASNKGAPIMSATSSASSYTDGFAAGATAERNRIVGILSSEEGRKRPGAALELAIADDGISIEAASRLLSRLPTEGAPQAGGSAQSAFRGGGTVSSSSTTPAPHMAGLLAMVDREAGKVRASAGEAGGLSPAGASQPPKTGLMAALDEHLAKGSR